jgi:hypothetical protein
MGLSHPHILPLQQYVSCDIMSLEAGWSEAGWSEAYYQLHHDPATGSVQESSLTKEISVKAPSQHHDRSLTPKHIIDATHRTLGYSMKKGILYALLCIS